MQTKNPGESHVASSEQHAAEEAMHDWSSPHATVKMVVQVDTCGPQRSTAGGHFFLPFLPLCFFASAESWPAMASTPGAASIASGPRRVPFAAALRVRLLN